ncbi:DUF6527 family protein (plasmid) [Ralstonia sp. R-29]|uniref:DUF6527 family protein n=1 Tax=Ralstonia sp. R-29 TaxID=3404059 RepID=UPI003CF2CE37
MSIFKRFAVWLAEITSFHGQREASRGNRQQRPKQQKPRPPKPLPPPTYHRLHTVPKPPQSAEISPDALVVVAPNDTPKWVMFRCPCPCSELITLSLQKVHKPHWSLQTTGDGRGTLYPSVWRTQGCRSHFWIKDGRVFWC